jgi:signal transduction histidine kinase
VFLTLGIGWIVASDLLIAGLVDGQAMRTTLQVAAGSSFVLVTGVYVFAGLRRERDAGSRAQVAEAGRSDLEELEQDSQQELMRMASRLETLHEIDRSMLGIGDRAELAGIASERLKAAVGGERISVLRFDLATGLAEVITTHDLEGRAASAEPVSVERWYGDVEDLLRGRTRIIPDVATLPPEMRGRYADQGIGSAVFVPMVVEGELIGLTGVSWTEPGGPDEERIAMVAEVADEMAVAIRTAELRAGLEERVMRLEWFHEVGRGILASTSIRDLTHGALISLRRVMPCDRAEVSVFDEGGVLLLASDGIESGEEWLADGERTRSLGDISDLRRGDARIVTDTGVADPKNVAAVGLAGIGIGAYATLPMTVDGALVGVLRIASAEPGSFPDEDLAIAKEMADQLAVAIRQGQLRGELEGHAADLERQVEIRTAELRETNDQLDAFAYSISHDLRAPLRAMQGFSQALLEDYGRVLGDEGRDYADRVVRAAARMDRLIRDLLAYSRLARQELSLVPVELASVVAEAIEQVRADPASEDVDLACEGPMPAVIGHRPTMQQILVNLLTNAVKFVDEGVRPRVRVWAVDRGDHVRLCVGDNGIGIDEAFHTKVFGVLERLHGVERYEGTGIGLAIVTKGAERMGGRAGVESAPGDGSTFWVELPAREGQAA